MSILTRIITWLRNLFHAPAEEPDDVVNLEWFSRSPDRDDVLPPRPDAPKVFLDTNIEQLATPERWTYVWQTINWGGKPHRDRILTTRKAEFPPNIQKEIPYLREVARRARAGELKLLTSFGVMGETQSAKIMPWLDNPFTGIPQEHVNVPWPISISPLGGTSHLDYQGDARFNQLKKGLSKQDAFNIRCAEEGQADYFITLDARLVRAIEGWRNLNLPFPVIPPSRLVQQLGWKMSK